MMTVLTTIGFIVLGFVSSLFIISILIQRNDIADIAWGTGILIVGASAFLTVRPEGLLALLLLALTTLWGVRLTVRILLRNVKKSEDPRYKVWRDSWGKWFYPRSYLQVYLLQGFLMIAVGYPLIHATVYGASEGPSVLTWVGLFVWCIGYFFEVVGDYQLDSFIKNPIKPTKVLQSGLWKYTRHPNYFGEVTMWWGIWLMVAHLPLSFIALIGPLTITFLILKVSGIPMLEKRFEGNPEFESYKEHTSAFIPLPPKRPI